MCGKDSLKVMVAPSGDKAIKDLQEFLTRKYPSDENWSNLSKDTRLCSFFTTLYYGLHHLIDSNALLRRPVLLPLICEVYRNGRRSGLSSTGVLENAADAGLVDKVMRSYAGAFWEVRWLDVATPQTFPTGLGINVSCVSIEASPDDQPWPRYRSVYERASRFGSRELKFVDARIFPIGDHIWVMGHDREIETAYVATGRLLPQREPIKDFSLIVLYSHNIEQRVMAARSMLVRMTPVLEELMRTDWQRWLTTVGEFVAVMLPDKFGSHPLFENTPSDHDPAWFLRAIRNDVGPEEAPGEGVLWWR